MSGLRLAINRVLGSDFGHMQLVFDPDDIWMNGDELEIEVQPTELGSGFWDVSPVQPLDLRDEESWDYDLVPGDAESASSQWELLVNIRDTLAENTVVYVLGVSDGFEGQNSNSYIRTIADAASIDLTPYVTDFYEQIGSSTALPGYHRNVLIENVSDAGEVLDPVALDVMGTDAPDTILGGNGGDTITGGGGDDTLIGGSGDDVITGSTLADLIEGGQGDDFVNGGYGYDRAVGGDGADRFYHAGVSGHGSDWLEDFATDQGDVLLFGGGSVASEDFQINYAHTPDDAGGNVGSDDVREAFVIFRPTGQILWALVDGEAQDVIQIRSNGSEFDLLA